MGPVSHATMRAGLASIVRAQTGRRAEKQSGSLRCRSRHGCPVGSRSWRGGAP